MNKIAENKLRMREVLASLELQIAEAPGSMDGKSLDLPVKHSFAGGVYTRELHIPKGTLAMGKIHKKEHHAFLLKGSCVILTENGVERMEAPRSMVSSAGAKRLLYSFTDVDIVTVHRTDCLCVEEAEKECVALSYDELNMEEVLCLG